MDCVLLLVSDSVKFGLLHRNRRFAKAKRWLQIFRQNHKFHNENVLQSEPCLLTRDQRHMECHQESSRTLTSVVETDLENYDFDSIT